jgi:hypothetical protein
MCGDLNRLLGKVRESYPKAALYLDRGQNLCLLTDLDLDHDKSGSVNQDNVIGGSELKASGGDW